MANDISDTIAAFVRLLGVGACNCLTKTPEVEYHKPWCRYRNVEERADFVKIAVEKAMSLSYIEGLNAALEVCDSNTQPRAELREMIETAQRKVQQHVD